MKYVRTKEGIFEYAGEEETCVGPVVVVDTKIPDALYRFWKIDRDKIIKQSDNLEDLCDEFVLEEYSIVSDVLYSRERFIFLKDAIRNQTATHKCYYKTYGMMWVTLPDGSPLLKPVAKLNDEGVLCLV